MPALWMLLACFLFACMGVCVKLGSGDFSAGELAFYRGLVGLVMMFALMRTRGIPLATPNWRSHVSRSVSGTAALMCYFFAIGQLPLATAVTLNYTSPIFVAVLLMLWFGERIKRQVFVAIALGFCGVALLLKPTLQPAQWLGAVAGLGSGMIASIAYLSVRELGRIGEPESRTVLWFSGVTSVVGLPWAIAGAKNGVDLRGCAILLGVGLFGALAQLAMTRAYRLGNTIVTASLAYATVVFSSIFGILLWAEHLPVSGWIAIALIGASGAWISFGARVSTPTMAGHPAAAARSAANAD